MKIFKLAFDGFDWDYGNWAKIEARLPSRSVEILFERPILVKKDFRHSGAEERFIAVGEDLSNRKMLVAFTLRKKQGEILIRPISARYMHEKEEVAFEEQIKKLKEK